MFIIYDRDALKGVQAWVSYLHYETTFYLSCPCPFHCAVNSSSAWSEEPLTPALSAIQLGMRSRMPLDLLASANSGCSCIISFGLLAVLPFGSIFLTFTLLAVLDHFGGSFALRRLLGGVLAMRCISFTAVQSQFELTYRRDLDDLSCLSSSEWSLSLLRRRLSRLSSRSIESALPLRSR